MHQISNAHNNSSSSSSSSNLSFQNNEGVADWEESMNERPPDEQPGNKFELFEVKKTDFLHKETFLELQVSERRQQEEEKRLEERRTRNSLTQN